MKAIAITGLSAFGKSDEPRWPQSRDVVAIASDAPLEAPLPMFAMDDSAALAAFLVHRLGIRSG